MEFTFQKATRKRAKAKLAIDGPSGSGKTYTALIAATALANGGKIAVIDTERGSASLYSDKFSFDVLELNTFSPLTYTEAIHAAEQSGYDVIVIDSLSHAWEGEGGALDMADDVTKRQRTPNSYTAWKEVTPIHRAMVDAILQSKCHIIATMRSKMDYVQEKDERTGKTVIRKVGMAPIQRAGMEYEFTLVGDMDLDHNFVVTKSRCDLLTDAVQNRPDAKFFKTFVDWLNSGEEPVNQSPKYEPVSLPPSGDEERVTSQLPIFTTEEEFLTTFEPINGYDPTTYPLDRAKAMDAGNGKTLGEYSTKSLVSYLCKMLIAQKNEKSAVRSAELMAKIHTIQTILMDRKYSYIEEAR